MPPGGVHRQDGLLLGLPHFRECVQVADELRRLLRVSVQPDSPVVEPIEQLLIRQIRLRRSRFIVFFIIITIILRLIFFDSFSINGSKIKAIINPNKNGRVTLNTNDKIFLKKGNNLTKKYTIIINNSSSIKLIIFLLTLSPKNILCNI